MEYTEEIWKPIKGYETRYEVSNLGRVRSLSRLIARKKTGNFIKHGCILSQGTTTHGYKQVFLYLNNVGKMYLVHRLVAEAFLEHIDGCNEINHKDENKENNTVWVNEDGSVDIEKSNLEWCNRQYNQTYGTLQNRRREKLIGKKYNTLVSIR